MTARKPRIEYYWTLQGNRGADVSQAHAVVNWRLIGANGEIMCQSMQGYRDKTDARRAVSRVADVFGWHGADGDQLNLSHLREVGPGRKPA